MPNNDNNGFVTQYALPLIELEEVDIVNDGNLILSNVNLKINKGEFVYLIGKVGSGKSSIIKTIIAELPIKRGKARVGDYSLNKIKAKQIPYLRRKIGVVFQDFQLLMDRTVEENLLFVLQSTNWKKDKEMKARALDVLKMVGMETKAHKMPHQLSGGEQQRIAIARALLNNPAIILADEPTGNLDSETATDIMNLLLKIHKEFQPAVIMVTHNRELFKKYPGKVMICENGECKQLQTELEEVNINELFVSYEK
ncbi:MAG: ATP-binding cassette domain-containing protein [Bacteroidales bacterium]